MRTLASLHSLSDRVAVVTGGAGHLGLALCESLAECGATVVVIDREEHACAERASAIAAHGQRPTSHIAVDLAAPGAARAVVEQTLARFGRLDVLVNNAAFTGASGLAGYAVPFPDQTVEAWDAALRVNVTAAFELAREARAALDASGTGAIVNIGSIYGLVGPNLSLYDGTTMGNPAAYGVSKAGLLQLTRYLATVLAPRVRVNSITPGGIERGQPQPFQDRYVAATPMRRMAREEDFKGAVAFLATDASSYMTGQDLVVDGGWTAW